MADRGRRPAACATSPGERIVRGVGALVMGGIAASTATNPWCAIPAAVCAAFLMIGAITGWCPTNLLTRRPTPAEANTLGYPEAPQKIDLPR